MNVTMNQSPWPRVHLESAPRSIRRRNFGAPDSLLRKGLPVLVPQRHVHAQEVFDALLVVAGDVAETLALALLDDVVGKVIHEFAGLGHLLPVAGEATCELPERAAKISVSPRYRRENVYLLIKPSAQYFLGIVETGCYRDVSVGFGGISEGRAGTALTERNGCIRIARQST